MSNESVNKGNGQENSLGGKNVLISGGTTGVGKATAILLSKKGARVFIYGRNQEALSEALAEINKSGGEAHGCLADQSKIEDVKQAFAYFDEQLGVMDILVNNASLGARSVAETELEDIKYVIDVNLAGYLYCTKLAISRMKKSHAGHIVMVGSMCSEVFDEGASVYVATKAGVRGLARSLRKEVNEMGIKVTLIESGNVATEMVREDSVEKKRQVEAGLMLSPDDIAEAIYFGLTRPNRVDVLSFQLKPRNQKF